MKTPIQTFLLTTGLVLSLGSAVAQTPAESAAKAASSAASAASSAEAAKKSAEEAASFSLPTAIVKGDRIKLRSNMPGLVPESGATGSRASAGTCLRVTRLNADGGITVAVEEGTGILSGTCRDPAGNNAVAVGDVYRIPGEQLKNASYSRYGWIAGPMIVPFKYFPHDRSFEPSQSLGLYGGFRTSWFESQGLSWVASAGLTMVKVSEVVDDPDKPGSKTTKENTVGGYTLAVGALFDLTREAKPYVAGLMVGRDFVGRNSALTYKHDNRTWVSFQIGWAQ